MTDHPDSIDKLRAENARLIALLEANGIEWRPPQPVSVQSVFKETDSNLTTNQKVGLFMRLFRGRTDVFPLRWESKRTGKSGYSPACLNEWAARLCDKPRIKCSDCSNRALRPLTEAIVYDHLREATP